MKKPALPVSTLNACSALVIDSHALSSKVTVQLLTSMGVGEILRVPQPPLGRAILEGRTVDFVFCDYHFDGSEATGQDFIDELRQDRILPYSTVVFFVTAEASYAKVANAAESGLDQYLLKPFTESSFTRRVEGSRTRKMALRDVFEAIDRDDVEEALALCEHEISSQGRFRLVACQIAAEACIRTQRLERAQELYEIILGQQAVPWARLGVARCEFYRGEFDKAQVTLESLIAEHPLYVDAYDVLGRCHMERGEITEALRTFQIAARLTPSCVRRLQKVGHVAFLASEFPIAAKALARAAALGGGSKLLDTQSLVLLAYTQCDANAASALEETAVQLHTASVLAPANYRLARFAEVAEILMRLVRGQETEALAAAKRMASHIDDPEFDFEAASNLFYTMDRLDQRGVRAMETREWARTAALRFCVSRVAVDTLRKCSRSPVHGEIIEHAASEISGLARSGLTRVIAGDRQAALDLLVDASERTRNARLLEIAQQILDKQGERDAGQGDLAAKVTWLKTTYCGSGTQAALRFRVDSLPPGRGSAAVVADPV
jgi:CheY-like chemotaxis protein